MPRPISMQARKLYAAAFLSQSPKSENLARNIVDGGFENWWITPALHAIDEALANGRIEDDEDA